jgi:hypothetical protein
MSRRQRAARQRVKAVRDSSLAQSELLGVGDRPTTRAAAGPTSYPVRDVDAATRALIDAALRERGLA